MLLAQAQPVFFPPWYFWVFVFAVVLVVVSGLVTMILSIKRAECAQRIKERELTGEQLLALADKLVPLGVSLEGLAAVIQPLYAHLGIKTGKVQAHQVEAPVGRVQVRALCSLARHGQTLREVNQAAVGCLLKATLPSDLFSLEGELLVSVRRNGPQAEVSGATCIGGQFFDRGKSNRCLDQLFTDLSREAA